MSSIWIRRPVPADIDRYHIGTAVEHLGITFTDVGDDWVAAKMETTPHTRQPYGTIHGGVSLVLAETLGSVGAAHCVDETRFRVFGQEINGNHLRPNYEGWVSGTAAAVPPRPPEPCLGHRNPQRRGQANLRLADHHGRRGAGAVKSRRHATSGSAPALSRGLAGQGTQRIEVPAQGRD